MPSAFNCLEIAYIYSDILFIEVHLEKIHIQNKAVGIITQENMIAKRNYQIPMWFYDLQFI